MSKFSVADIVNRVWGYANVLRDDGISNGDYVEQLTLLIFLKMNAERAESGKINKNEISEAWSMLTTLQGKGIIREVF
ncbi:type I restriction-modification system subunit M N-terminal domain-containing protein [Klebsiella pneumoniae subsp. pneumoniae]|nr:type I restriction-modification system subunit M N-terminal domain-containing protein [Klebsiella pneumoniae subsp. pneumoniae]